MELHITVVAVVVEAVNFIANTTQSWSSVYQLHNYLHFQVPLVQNVPHGCYASIAHRTRMHLGFCWFKYRLQTGKCWRVPPPAACCRQTFMGLQFLSCGSRWRLFWKVQVWSSSVVEGMKIPCDVNRVKKTFQLTLFPDYHKGHPDWNYGQHVWRVKPSAYQLQSTNYCARFHADISHFYGEKWWLQHLGPICRRPRNGSIVLQT